MKGFFKIILWSISILALCISLFVIVSYNASQLKISKDVEDALELKERIVAVEKENEMLEEKVKQLQDGIYNHIHKQYALTSFYQGKGTEYQLENNTVLVFPRDK